MSSKAAMTFYPFFNTQIAGATKKEKNYTIKKTGKFFCCSLLLGISLLVVGSTLIHLFKGEALTKDPFHNQLKISGIALTIIGIVVTTCAIFICCATCFCSERLNNNETPVDSPMHVPSTCNLHETLSLPPLYPPPAISSTSIQDDGPLSECVVNPGYLPGSLPGAQPTITSNSFFNYSDPQNDTN